MSANWSSPRARSSATASALVMPGRQLTADQAGEDQVGGVAEDLGTDAVSSTLSHGEDDDRDRAGRGRAPSGR